MIDYDLDLLLKINDRAHALNLDLLKYVSREYTLRTITAVAMDHPIDWESMSTACDYNFVHDFNGMLLHYKPSNGKFTECWMPRFAIQQHEEK